MYQVRIKENAMKQILKLPNDVVGRIDTKIQLLSENPRPHGCKKLKGFHDLYRIRVSDYRIIYSIADDVLVIEVLQVNNRKDAYR